MAESSGRVGLRTGLKVKAQKAQSSIQHPYKEFEGTARWRLVNRAIDALVKNGDLEEKTNRVYIVGYICHMLSLGQSDDRSPEGVNGPSSVVRKVRRSLTG